jgi:hypothetical protein
VRVVCLYGPPGVGKLTVGTELAARTGIRLLHNHLTINLVTALYPRETPAWARFLQQVRCAVFAEEAREGLDLITTGVYLGTAAQVAAITARLEPVWASGGAVDFVQLACARDELVRRVQDGSRRRHDKLTDPALLLARFDPEATLPFEPQVRLDTTRLPPAEAAARIAAHYGLPVTPT